MVAVEDARHASADELREVLDRALRELDSDQRAGPLLRAAGLSIRIEMTDIDLVVRVAAAEDHDHHLRWSFGDDAEPAKLTLRMDSATANAYLQGKESLAIAIARGKVRTAGDSRVALLYLPAMRLVAEPYRRLVAERYPHLSLV
jgi:hypothetical protein